MATYIKKSYFLLLMIKLHGEDLTTYNKKTKKTEVDNLFNSLSHQLICPLNDLESLYEQLIDAFLPTEGNPLKPLNELLVISNPIIELLDDINLTPPPHDNLRENSSYISLTEAKDLALHVLHQNYNQTLDALNQNNIDITYQDLAWLRLERDITFRSEDHGNTDTYRNIAHKIKAAILERLYTLSNKVGEQAELPPDNYDKYLSMMQKNCGRYPMLTKFFKCSTEAEFYKLFSKGIDHNPIALDPSAITHEESPSM